MTCPHTLEVRPEGHALRLVMPGAVPFQLQDRSARILNDVGRQLLERLAPASTHTRRPWVRPLLGDPVPAPPDPRHQWAALLACVGARFIGLSTVHPRQLGLDVEFAGQTLHLTLQAPGEDGPLAHALVSPGGAAAHQLAQALAAYLLRNYTRTSLFRRHQAQ